MLSLTDALLSVVCCGVSHRVVRELRLPEVLPLGGRRGAGGRRVVDAQLPDLLLRGEYRTPLELRSAHERRLMPLSLAARRGELPRADLPGAELLRPASGRPCERAVLPHVQGAVPQRGRDVRARPAVDAAGVRALPVLQRQGQVHQHGPREGVPQARLPRGPPDPRGGHVLQGLPR